MLQTTDVVAVTLHALLLRSCEPPLGQRTPLSGGTVAEIAGHTHMLSCQRKCGTIVQELDIIPGLCRVTLPASFAHKFIKLSPMYVLMAFLAFRYAFPTEMPRFLPVGARRRVAIDAGNGAMRTKEREP